MKKLSTPRAFIFDWDNTLVDTWPIIHMALVNTFTALGREAWPLEMTKNRVRKSMRDSFPEIFGENWQAAGDRYQKEYRSRNLEMLTALPDAEATLKVIKELGLPNFVVSNKRGPNLRKEIEHLGWTDYFVRIIGSDDAARDKPHADPVHMVLEKTGLEPGSDLWFVGDSEIDLECAEGVGCTGILFGDHARTHKDYSPTHYQGFTYHAHVDTHEELVGLIRSSLTLQG